MSVHYIKPITDKRWDGIHVGGRGYLCLNPHLVVFKRLDTLSYAYVYLDSLCLSEIDNLVVAMAVCIDVVSLVEVMSWSKFHILI